MCMYVYYNQELVGKFSAVAVPPQFEMKGECLHSMKSTF